MPALYLPAFPTTRKCFVRAAPGADDARSQHVPPDRYSRCMWSV